MVTRVELGKIVEGAEGAYNGKEYEKAVDLVDKFLGASEEVASETGEKVIQELGVKAYRIKGWALYYIGRKKAGPGGYGEVKEYIEAAMAWRKVLILTSLFAGGIGDRISALNGLPLAYWFHDNKKLAYAWSDQGIREAEKTQDPAKIVSAYNTRNILLREDKKYAEAIKGCQKVFKIASEVEDFRTAGHGMQNIGDTYRLMVKAENDVEKMRLYYTKAIEAYQKALEMYKKYEEETRQKATAHIEAAARKYGEAVQEMANLLPEYNTLADN